MNTATMVVTICNTILIALHMLFPNGIQPNKEVQQNAEPSVRNPS